MILENQVTPFRIPTKDGERLFAWLVAPLGLYAKHADEFVSERSGLNGDIEEKLAFKLLRDDPEARLLIYCNTKLPLTIPVTDFHGSSRRKWVL